MCAIVSEAGAALHLAELFGDEGGDLVGFFAAVSEGLVEIEVRKSDTAQRRLMVVASVEADCTVRDVNAVTS